MKIKDGRKVIFLTHNANMAWDGRDIRGNDVKPGKYSYEIEIKTVHSEMVKLEGKICLARFEKKYEKRWLGDFCDCILGDRIDPRQGIVYSSSEICK